jgi:hypothetical protein
VTSVPAAFSGSLLSRRHLETLSAVARQSGPDATVAKTFRQIWRRAAALGRRAANRTMADVFAKPLGSLLGFDVRGFGPAPGDRTSELLVAGLTTQSQFVALMGVAGQPLEQVRARIVAATAASGARWCVFVDGRSVSLVDCARPHARRWLTADAMTCAADVNALRVLVSVMGAQALAGSGAEPAPIESMIARSEADLRDVRAALQRGVERAALTLTTALSRPRRAACDLESLFADALTVVYRVLFLQFAEARGLVPVWHPTYRRGYTVEALREQLERGSEATGVWDALQAMARLAHRGAHAGELVVVPFNGRLFSPLHAPSAERRIPDTEAAAALASLTLVGDGNGRPERIPFLDLGVEQLGSIYERVLDFAPERDPKTGQATLVRGLTRKTTGSFYTPRPITEFLVRRTLEPLVAARSPEEILQLKVLDPAMGSGAFLVAACRFLARAYEDALLRSGVAGADDLTAADRAGFRRTIAQHCLFGVDLNPMAVQLGRLSLWLCSLSADKPLTFLDHRLRTGNSVIGASIADVSSRAPGRRGRAGDPTLFGADTMEAIGRALEVRKAIDAIHDDTLENVRRKELLFSDLDSSAGPLAAWRTICDAWCAAWFAPAGASPSAQEFGAMCAAARGDTSFTHASVLERLGELRRIAVSRRFFHWELEFPDVLCESGPSASGFDAIVGNPPWEMVRGAPGTQQVLRFTRESGTYRLQSTGHSNAYQLFLERSLRLLRPGGRLGLVLPWGVASDEGSAALRRYLFDRCSLDEIAVLDNREGIFPIHRALKFVALCGTNDGRTEAIRLSPSIRNPADLDRVVPDNRCRTEPVEISRGLLHRISGDTLAVPQISSVRDVQILEFLSAAAPPASSRTGWGLHFGRELNATDDKDAMSAAEGGYPVISGRDLSPFKIATDRTTFRIAPEVARRRLGDAVSRHRLAYRDVAGAGNRMTLIAALVPPRVVTTHTVFCLKTRLAHDHQLFLCAVLNSYIANYVVRTRVGTHVTTAIVHALPLPCPSSSSAAFLRVVAAARAVASSVDDLDATCRMQAEVAALYAVSGDMLSAILDTFPLVPASERDAVRSAHEALAAI